MLLDCLQNDPDLLIPEKFKHKIIPSLKPFLIKYDTGELLIQTFSGKHFQAAVFDAFFTSPKNIQLTKKAGTALVSMMSGEVQLFLHKQVSTIPVDISKLIELKNCIITVSPSYCRFSIIYWNSRHPSAFKELTRRNINRYSVLSPEDRRVLASARQIDCSHSCTSILQEALLESVVIRAFEQFESPQLGLENLDPFAREAQQLRSQLDKYFDKPGILREYIKKKSTQKIARRFQKLFSLTPSEYLVSLRLSHAKKHLLVTNTPIQEIAWEVGFESSAIFSRHFSNNEKLSPSKFRAIYKHHF